jgi:hypothetical protein
MIESLFDSFNKLTAEEFQQASDAVHAYICAKCNELPKQDIIDAFDAMQNSNDTG